jgi:hypothetical protein
VEPLRYNHRKTLKNKARPHPDEHAVLSDNRKANPQKEIKQKKVWSADREMQRANLMVKPMGLISTGQLNTLLRLHTQPINLVVFQGPHRENSSSVGLHA